MTTSLKAAIVALLGLSTALGTSQAQTTASYTPGDLLVGFRASDGTGATKNYVVNLGSAETLSSLTNSKLFGADGAIATDLVAIFGADWNTRADVFWSVSGTAGSFAPVGTIPAKTLFATFPESTPGTYETTVWVRGSSTAQGVVTSKMNGFATAFKSYTPSANNPVGVIQNQTDANSYGSYQKGGTLPNSGPAPGISFAYFNPSIEASFAGGASASALDLVKLEPATSEFVGTRGTILGRFAISPSGTITFTPKPTGVPPVIASQPQSTGINAGGSALLSVSASTPEGVTYQWSKDGSAISGATASSYLATSTGSYTVTLTTTGGSVTSQAAVVSTSTLGQLFLGFRASDGTGATKNYLVKLGSASNFTNGTSIASFGTDGAIAKDLIDLFGADWSTRSDLFWSVSGTTGSFQSVGGLPAKTLFASIAELTPGTFESNRVWTRASATAQGIVTSKMTSLSTAFAGSGASSNNPLGVVQNQTDSNSYGSFQKGGTLANSGPAPGISFAYFNPSIEANFQSGAANSILDLVQLEPGSADSIGAAGALLGRLRISPSGVVDFIPKNTVEVSPIITAQPSAPAGGALASGASATLSVTAAGAGLSYQWRKDGVIITGATSASYIATSPGAYSVAVSNSIGSTVSSDIVLTGPPVIASQPASTGLNTGGSALLMVSATVTQGITYQWSKDGSPITGATASSYLATAPGSYTVALTNTAGSVTSQAAVVSTSTLGQLFLGFRASDGTGATKNYLVKLGSASNFTNGTSAISFGADGSIAKDLADLFGADWSSRSDVFWSVSGTTGSFQSVGGLPAKTLFASIAEATPGTFESSRIWTRASSTAQGIVTSRMNSLSTAFAGYSPSPNNPLGVIQNQTDSNSYGSFQKGGTLANSGPAPGISFAYFNPTIEANFQSGAANSVLDLVQLEPGSGNTLGTAGTLLGRLRISASGVVDFIPKNIVEVSPSITSQPTAPSGGVITNGGSATLSVNAAGTGLSYQWRKDGSDILGATSASYTATATGTYTVVVTNSAGSVASSAIILMSPVPPPVITAQPSGGVLANGSLSLSVTATGSGLSYQWRKDDSNIQGATSATYTANAAGSYSVVVTNSAGSVTSNSAVVTAPVTPPVITAQPSGGVLANGSLSLSVTATGSGLSYQWRKDGSNIQGATSAAYTANAAGSYSVVVTNSAGSVTSIAVPVTLSLVSLSGEYQGLLLAKDPSQLGHHGVLVATVSKPVGKTPASVTITGKLQRATGAFSFTGKVNAYGEVTFGTKNLPSLTVTGMTGTSLNLKLVSNSSGRTLEGKLTSTSADIASVSALPVITPSGAQLGSHTALFQQVADQGGSYPDGDGYATMSVTSSGITLAGKLADGSTIATALKLTNDATAPLFVSVYNGKGLIAGGIKFDATETESDAACVGMRWMRAANLATPAGYLAGWPNGITVDFVASKYDKTKGFGLANTSTSGLNLKFVASGGDLPSPVEGTPNLSSKNVLTVLKSTSNPSKLTTKFTTTTGALSGTFTVGGETKATTFAGVILQKSNLASGFFLRGTKSATKSGLIQITE